MKWWREGAVAGPCAWVTRDVAGAPVFGIKWEQDISGWHINCASRYVGEVGILWLSGRAARPTLKHELVLECSR